MADFLMYISLALVLTWTIQIARAKHRNPWLWGGATAGIMVTMVVMGENDPRMLVCMVPMVILLFLKSPQTTTSPSPQGVECGRCRALQPHGRYYCTSCGWELKRDFPDSSPTAGETSISSQPTEAPDQQPASPAPQEPIATSPSATAPAEEVSSQSRQDAPTPEPTAAQPGGTDTAAGSDPTQAAPAPGPTSQPTPDTDPAPSLPRSAIKPMSRGIPTAVTMTERGRSLVEEGRVQEGIDQFTKALALDSSYTLALEARAAAYELQGRHAEAEQDRRQLDAAGA